MSIANTKVARQLNKIGAKTFLAIIPRFLAKSLIYFITE